MGQLVNLVVGVWEQVSNGGWLFLEDPTERKYGVMVHENQTYASLMDLVRTRYSVGVQTAIALTYEFPEWMKVPGDIASPPGDVREDGEVDLFMSIRLEIPELRLLVTIGNDVVARYLFKRRDNCTVVGSSTGGVPPKSFTYRGNSVVNHPCAGAWPDMPGGISDGTAYWESMLAQGWVSTNQQYLMDVCTDDEVCLLPKNAMSKRTPSRVLAFDSSEDTNSSTDSSAVPMNAVPPIDQRGIIRLDDSNQPLVSRPSMALTIVEPQPKRYSLLEYLTKGKGKLADTDAVNGKRERPTNFSYPPGQNPNFPDPEPYHESTDDDSEVDGNQHLYVGQVFLDRSAFKTHMSLYALAKKFRFYCRRSEPGKMVLECKGHECKWRVSASKLGGCPRFQIKTLNDEHTCTVDERGDFKRHATSKLIGEMVKNKFTGVGTGPKPGAVREYMRTDHQVPITYWKAWRSREVAIERGLGNTADAYKALPSFLEQLCYANPGSVVALETGSDGPEIQRFKYMFLSLAASVKGYAYMRKVVVVDGTHLKGKYVGCLLTASAQDANYQIFPLAFAVVDGENDQAWTWFFKKLLDVVEDGDDLVFVSDRHQSIYAGLRQMYPKAKHCACILHLQRNIVTMFKKKHLAFLVSKAARAYRVCDFYTHFNEIKMVDSGCADYLTRIGFEHWTRSHSRGMRYNLMTSNVAESLNAALTEAREYPIVALLEYIRSLLMGWFSGRREAAASCGGLVTPKMEEVISKKFDVSTGFVVRHINKSEYEVKGMDGVPFIVDLDQKVCSCLEFDMLQIPCVHAVSAAIQSNKRVDSLVGEKYTRNSWAAAYSMSINPAGNYMTPAPEPNALGSLQLAPPTTRRPPGRPRKSRILSRGEFKKGGKGRRIRTCGRCGGADHNRATCKKPI